MPLDALIRDAHVVVATSRFSDDLAALTDEFGFRVDAIYPADAPSTAIVSAHGVRLRLEATPDSDPVTVHLITDDRSDSASLPGGSTIQFRPFTTTYEMPVCDPSLVIMHDDGERGVGRAGMTYRDLIPDRWGGRFVASHIVIVDGGPVPDYVHFHKVRFQMIFVKAGWVRLVYEDQGDPFVMVAGDCVLQPPEIRHRVLESSPGLEVIEIGCPALHETIADWSLALPNGSGDSAREWHTQRFVRHTAAGSEYAAWRLAGWEFRDTGIGIATGGLAGARVLRPTAEIPVLIGHTEAATEFELLVVLNGTVTFATTEGVAERLTNASSVAIPRSTRFTLTGASEDCEVLEVTLPA